MRKPEVLKLNKGVRGLSRLQGKKREGLLHTGSIRDSLQFVGNRVILPAIRLNTALSCRWSVKNGVGFYYCSMVDVTEK